MGHPKTCLTQQSMKYGTALHVGLHNHDFRLAYRIAKCMTKVKDFCPQKEFNRVDSDGNAPLHLVMRYFNQDVYYAKKMCLFLLQNGANINLRNKNDLTPLNQALYYVQNTATSFALEYNELMRGGAIPGQHAGFPFFDFNERGSKLLFTPLHYSVK